MGKKVIKTLAFVLIFAGFLATISKSVATSGSLLNYQRIHVFYEERKESLDAVYIGASNVFTSWTSPIAWKHYGIAVCPFSTGAQPFEAAEYMIREARKTQPDALYIVSMNVLNSGFTEQAMHYLVDYLPLSVNKFQLIQKLSDYGGYTTEERLEFFAPLLRFHSRWNELVEDDFTYSTNGLKGGSSYTSFLRTVTDVSGNFRSTSRHAELTESVLESLDSLLDYCDSEKISILFVVTPQIRTNEYLLAQYNTIYDIVKSRGYPALNMMEHINDIGLNLTTDYSDEKHTNIHGSLKVTDYFARYLVENFGFQDKRGDPLYSDWDEAYDKYVEVIAPHSLDFEYTNAGRNLSLDAPELSSLSVSGTTLTLKWENVSGADGYQVYRKTGDSGWTPVASVDADTLTYADEDCTIAEKYTYTVAAFQEKDGEKYWGNYDFDGLSATALISAPESLQLSGGENNLTLTWKRVKGADGYQVSRRVFAKTWSTIADAEPETSYTDTAMLSDIPYQYRVRAFWHDEEDNIVYGSYSSIRLWLPELSGPEVTAELKNGVPTLSWPTVEGITGYTVYRKTAGEEWTQIAEPLPADCTEFRDITAPDGTACTYQVEAYLTYSGETYRYPTETAALSAQSAPTRLVPPVISFGEQVGNNIRLVWETQKNATAYRIYRQEEGSDTWTVVNKSTTSSTYQQAPPENGTYVYAIQCLRTENGCTYYGEFQEEAGITVEYHK